MCRYLAPTFFDLGCVEDMVPLQFVEYVQIGLRLQLERLQLTNSLERDGRGGTDVCTLETHRRGDF